MGFDAGLCTRPILPTQGRRTLSTGQAARLCSVNADTVLKWIKKGRLKAVRTAGGHYRIDRADLDALLASSRADEPRVVRLDETPRQVRCWELRSQDGEVKAECQSCAVYQVRASWCFLLAQAQSVEMEGRRHCQQPCDECLYHGRLKGRAARVLIVGSDESARLNLEGRVVEGLVVSFAGNGYEASAMLGAIRPDFVIVDEEMLNTTEAGLLAYLAGQAGLPGMQVGAAVAGASSRPASEAAFRDAAFLVEKPVSAAGLEALLQRYGVEVLPEWAEPGTAGGVRMAQASRKITGRQEERM